MTPMPAPDVINQPRITVAICTHNRSAILRDTLSAVLNQDASSFTFDVLVVDNASTDNTREVVAAFQDRSVPVHYLYAPMPGLSYARNRAIDYVTAPFLAYLDDDAVPEPGWLRALIEVFDSIRPMPGAVGGRVALRWTAKQPDWMPNELLGIYSLLDYGDAIQSVRMVHGCNMAFPTAILRQYRFDLRLGVSGKEQLAGEDTDILLRLQRDNLLVYYQPAAVVWHVVGLYRENQKYVMKRSRGVGRAEALYPVIHKWPGRLSILRMMLQYTWDHRHWWKRIALGVVSGKLIANPRERTWMRSVLIRWWAFLGQMARLVQQGAASILCGGLGTGSNDTVDSA